MSTQAIHSQRVLIDGDLRPATIFIKDELIEDVQLGFTEGAQSLGDLVIMPGLIDSHVHINDPGTDWEGFDTATMAAAAGGITTLVDMPLNSNPVTIDEISFNKKIKAAKNKLHVHCGFWGGSVPQNIDQLGDLWSCGVLGYKSFLINSGLDAFAKMEIDDLYRSFIKMKKLNARLLAHCELEEGDNIKELIKNPTSYNAFLSSRPASWENNAISLLIELSEKYQVPVHIVHLSSADSLDQIKKAKDRGVRVTVETCPHYLFFNSEEIPDKSTLYKCTPPIRSKDNNTLLWAAVQSGLIDFIVSDHSPCPSELKSLESGNFIKAWGGISGLQFGLSTIWTIAKSNGMKINQLSNLMSLNVAKFLDLDSNKGKLEKGYDADIVIWDPKEKYTVSENDIFHRHKISPYVGSSLFGKVKQTYVLGSLVYDDGHFINLNKGRLILRN